MIFVPKKSLGQNFLNDSRVLRKIIEKGKITSNNVVIEVGPGSGVLTKEIFEKKPKRFIVIEKDKILVNILVFAIINE